MILPSLFISHGAPTFANQPGRLGPLLARVSAALPRPKAVLIVSPHWRSRQIEVQAAARPDTIHDFSGFPEALYRIAYPAPGAPELAAEILARLTRKGLVASLNTARGRDHGAWVPMLHAYPDAQIPVIQISQPSSPSPLALLELGQAVGSLRDEGVLIIGSGSLTHNLRDLGDPDAQYAPAFADWIWGHIADDDLGALLDYRSRAPAAIRAHPTDEHLLPLFFAIGAAGADWRTATRLEGGVTYTALSMDSFVFGQRLELETGGADLQPA